MSGSQSRLYYCCFIDYTKAFDQVQHNFLMEILYDFDMSDKDLRSVQNMYFKHSALIRHKGKISGQVPIKRGVRQGDSPSPDYFSLYSEMIMQEIDGEEGLKINGINVNNLRFAVDIVLMAASEKAL